MESYKILFNKLRTIYPKWIERLHRQIRFYQDPKPISFNVKQDSKIVGHMIESKKLSRYVLVGVDGSNVQTSNYSKTYGIIKTVGVCWNLNVEPMHVLERYTISKYKYNMEMSSSISAEMLAYELVTCVCILKAVKYKKFCCDNCKLPHNRCSMKINRGFWEDFEDLEPVGILDQAIDFSFLKKPPNPYISSVLLQTVNWIFKEIKKHELKIIFITHASKTRNILFDLGSDFEKVLKSINAHEITLLEALFDEINQYSRENGSFEIDSNIFKEFLVNKYEILNNYTDFDLIRKTIDQKAAASPIFEIIEGSSRTFYSGLRVAYQLISWGMYDEYKGEEIYFPLDDIKLGYPLNNTEDIAFDVFLFETALGKGYSYTLTLAHTLASVKRSVKKIFEIFLAQEYNLIKSLKEQKKWRYFN